MIPVEFQERSWMEQQDLLKVLQDHLASQVHLGKRLVEQKQIFLMCLFVNVIVIVV